MAAAEQPQPHHKAPPHSQVPLLSHSQPLTVWVTFLAFKRAHYISSLRLSVGHSARYLRRKPPAGGYTTGIVGWAAATEISQ
ncbi:uncharacterized protein QC763_0080330 [Podospora pseudopauciseta]|uniref:Uncharacterized protein n=1 Tax=Podospora pseudopauciseta TaxID=2093780 RepID=A0ABR0H764_9PEZI|nr:hypothetical protein QC763_0080330 [Podospora pseudopauciseta]